MKRLLLLACLFLALCLPATAAERPQVIAGTCESLYEPVALDVAQPRLSWMVQSTSYNAKQTAYQIVVASSQDKLTPARADYWNSGKVLSGRSIQIPYQGKALPSNTTLYWKVKVWYGNKASGWSQVHSFGTGFLRQNDWKAEWIGLDQLFPGEDLTTSTQLAARYFRKEFKLDGTVSRARLYICGLGMYELHLNGQRIGEQVLAPVPTDYTQDVKYNVFDVTKALREGENAVGVALGSGRFVFTRQHRKPWKNRTYGMPKLLLQLEVEYTDGHRSTLVSDESWKATANGPIRMNNEYDGETYDANLEMDGWTRRGFEDGGWLQAHRTTAPGENRKYFAADTPQGNEPRTPHGDLSLKEARRVAQVADNMRVMELISPKSIREVSKDTFVIDMGQNFTGWLQFRVQAPKGTTIRLHYAENVNPDGSIYTLNLRGALTTDTYTAKGKGVESYEPTFVWHGFRYVEVTGWPGTPKLSDFTGKFVFDGIGYTGGFECSDDIMNRVYRNAWHGIASNYKGMPVDCPQRDERQPWLGDRSTGCFGESFLFDNQRIYAKWADDIQESMTGEGQIPDVCPNHINYYTDNMTWPGTYVFIVDMLYQQFADTASVTKHYPYMKRWLSYMESRYLNSKGLMDRDKYGDWCMPPESPELIHSLDTTRITDGTLIATAYYYKILGMMERFAGIQGLKEEQNGFARKAAEVSKAFNVAFFDRKNGWYANNTATANTLALAFNLVEASAVPAVFAHLTDVIEKKYDRHICTGIIGTAWLFRTLTRYGRGDLAFKLASDRTYPSYGYMAEKGATTIWELWNGDTANPWMNSQNHVMLLGDLLIWYYEHCAGIRAAADGPGFSKLWMEPDFNNGLKHVNASHRTPYGTIYSTWSKDASLRWDIGLPANTEATVVLPAMSLTSIVLNGKPLYKTKGVELICQTASGVQLRLGSGSYHFELPMQ